MGVIIEPNLVVPDILIEVNKNDEYGAESIKNTWGQQIPVIKINDYLLSAGEVKSFNLKIGINKLPSFSLTVIDSQYDIRRSLKKQEIDTSIIFIGFKDWYLKFNAIILTTPSDAGDEQLFITGSFYNEKLYNSIQKQYNNLSIIDVLKDICTQTNMGLFVCENTDLSNILENNINDNNKQLDFFDYQIRNFTNNIWSVDTHGYFHVSNIDTLKNQPFDKIKIFEGKILSEPKDLIITTNIYDPNSEENEDPNLKILKFSAEYFTINSNIGNVHIQNNNVYDVKTPDSGKVLSSKNIGISSQTENTFSRFLNSFFPFYKERINKDIGGKVINVMMRNLIYELTPFSIVNLEVFLPKISGTKVTLDTENSGKKIVIGYEFDFENKNDDSNIPTIRQSIDLI